MKLKYFYIIFFICAGSLTYAKQTDSQQKEIKETKSFFTHYCTKVEEQKAKAKEILQNNPFKNASLPDDLKKQSLEFCQCLKKSAEKPNDAIPKCMLTSLQYQSLLISRHTRNHENPMKYRQVLAIKANIYRDDCFCKKENEEDIVKKEKQD